MGPKRITAFDYLKGIAIFLVVWCHCIQYITGQTFENTFYSIIYSFHMPLFIIISGFFFHKKINNDIIPLIKKQFNHLIVPNLSWGIIVLCISIITTHVFPSIVDIIKLSTFCWFLSSLFVCSIIYAIIYRIGVKNYIAETIILSMTSLLIPGSEFIKFFIPFFGIGLIIRNTNIAQKKLKWKYIIILGGIISILYYLFWSRDFYIYCTKNPSFIEINYTEWIAYLARIIFGSLISIWFILLFVKIDKIGKRYNDLLTMLSRNSLGIYVIHYSLFYIISKHIKLKLDYPEIITIVTMFFLSCLIVSVINIAIFYLRSHCVTRILFLGEPKQQNN